MSSTHWSDKPRTLSVLWYLRDSRGIKLSSGHFDLESSQLTEWVKQEELPSNAYHSEMYKESTNKEDYGRCILFSTCTGSTANVISDSFVVTNKACLEKHQRHNKTSCQNENLKLLEVTYPA